MAQRTQIYLEDDQRARLDERARREGLSMAALVRAAVEAFLSDEDDLDATFGAAPGIGSRIPGRDEWQRGG